MIRPVRPDGTIETGGIFVPIIRQRVIDRIASAAIQRVVLIVAPAGYGKSVALRQYLDTLIDPHLRYDVQPDNAGLLGFLRGLAAAIAPVAPDARGTLAGAYEKNAGAQSPGTDLALWMHSHLKSFRGVIAIDDLQVAQEDREVTRFLTSLIERTKGRVQWVIASRATMGLPIGTWLAYGESDLAIDEHDLKFSVEEAKDAARAFRLGVRDEELFELLHLTDGWATAMTFALRSSTRSVDLRNISSMTREMIYHYLAEQVYHALSDEGRRFIETAALLTEVDLSVLVAAGFDGATALIADLRARVAFIHEDEPGRYRLHDMFKDFVLHQAALHGTEALRQNRLRLGRILEDLGRQAQALHLYVESGSPEDCLRVLTSHGVRLLDGGFADEVDFATSATLGASYASNPAVIGLRGLVDIARGMPDDGERKIVRSLRAMLDAPLRADLTLRLAVHRWNRGDVPEDMLDQLLAGENVDASVRTEGEAFVAACLVRGGKLAQAREIVSRVEGKLDAIDDDESLARILFRLGNVYYTLNELEAEKQMFGKAASIAAKCGLWGIASRAYRNLSVVALLFENEPTTSLVFAQEAALAATRAGDYADLRNALLSILSLETRRGNGERASQIERQLGDLGSGSGVEKNDYIASSQAHRHAWSARYAEAHRLFGSILDRQAHLPDRAIVRACHALCLALDGQLKESGIAVTKTIALLDTHAQGAEAYGGLLFDFSTAILVLAELGAGRNTSAQRIFKRPIYSNHEAAQAMRKAVEECSRSAKTPSYISDGLEAALEALRELGFGGYARHVQNVAEDVRRRSGGQASSALTPAELRVIRNLAGGMSPKEIAAEMGRSVYTIQTHIQNLIEKFDCHGRAEAIAAARRLGLIEEAQ
jgi:DNA-binding CsgD family transcriptional regulator